MVEHCQTGWFERVAGGGWNDQIHTKYPVWGIAEKDGVEDSREIREGCGCKLYFFLIMSGQLAGKWKTFIMAQKILQLITPSSIQNLRVLGGEGKVEILQPALKSRCSVTNKTEGVPEYNQGGIFSYCRLIWKDGNHFIEAFHNTRHVEAGGGWVAIAEDHIGFDFRQLRTGIWGGRLEKNHKIFFLTSLHYW